MNGIKMTITPQLRPCIILKKKGGRTEALFHTWAQEYAAGIFALCELSNGNMVEVKPERIQFLDSSHGEYDFTYSEVEEDL